MAIKQIKYIAFYSNDFIGSQNRQMAISATNKIDYICSAFRRNNYEVELISPSWTNNQRGYYKGEVINAIEGVFLRIFASFGAKNKIQRICKYIFSLFQLLLYLLFNTKKGEPIVVYHSISLSLPIRIVKHLKKIKLILEVEEIYQDIQSHSKYMTKSEYKLFESADSFIFSTELLNNSINKANKPYIIINGTYQVEEDRKCKFNDDKIHVVYAGTFDPRKGGALAAAAVAEYLPKNYHIHIIGFGSKDDTSILLKKIDELSKNTEATITYDGLFSGEAYIRFLQKCDIGLSTQTPEAAYNETSFPSKILSYMANGLRVVSVRIKTIEISTVGQEVYYYDEPNPKAIASTITSIDLSESYNSREIIRRLNLNFTENIKKLLEE
ncbi:conserved protein of unknown function [Petrocella atlantisensis]|uniref:Glycosyl transferase family 1 domain-containing protein n=1 Tax=Petrocella atlantisensis TaxID=2173034 RepID=A0A3P7NSP7_9FIRM|nr:glycosyltransferase [Petrocella atlantisensis]VDN46214.1 conserved protein of unknown function [Petrocella atlantisensis]